MTKYDFDRTIDRRIAHSRKWDVLDNEISLTVADTDYQVMDEIMEEVNRINLLGRFGYTSPDERYFNSYVHWFGSRYQAKFEVEDCLFSTGVVASIDSILKHLGKPHDKVMMFTPIYNVFYNCVRNNDCDLLECPLTYHNYQYFIDWELFDKQIKNAKFFILCNPHNPVGMMFDRTDLEKISKACLENNVYLISDEIHADIDYNQNRYVSMLNDFNNDKLIVCLSPGKTFNLAGMHSSIVVVKNEILRDFIQAGLWKDDIGEPSYFGVDPVSIAYLEGETYVTEMNKYLKANRELFIEFLKGYPKLHLVKNTHTYLLWIDISEYGLDSDKFVQKLREKTGLLVASGKVYGDPRFIRINIATSKQIIEESLQRLEKFIKNL